MPDLTFIMTMVSVNLLLPYYKNEMLVNGSIMKVGNVHIMQVAQLHAASLVLRLVAV